MSTTHIRVMNSGPLHVTGEFELVDAAGNRYPHKGIFSLCRCGLSACKPYCDGSHRAQRWENTVQSDKPAAAAASTPSTPSTPSTESIAPTPSTVP